MSPLATHLVADIFYFHLIQAVIHIEKTIEDWDHKTFVEISKTQRKHKTLKCLWKLRPRQKTAWCVRILEQLLKPNKENLRWAINEPHPCISLNFSQPHEMATFVV